MHDKSESIEVVLDNVSGSIGFSSIEISERYFRLRNLATFAASIVKDWFSGIIIHPFVDSAYFVFHRAILAWKAEKFDEFER